MSVTEQVAALEAEVVRLRAIQANVDGHVADVARRMYRRGYLAGRAAQRRGAALTTAPERHARGELRTMLGEGAAR